VFHSGSIFALLAAIASAIAFSAIRNLNLKNEPIERVLFFLFGVSLLATFPFSYANWLWPRGDEWVLLIGIGLAALINHFLLVKAYKYASASYLAPLSYISLIYAALADWLIFKEPIGMRSLLGSLFIIFAGYLTYLFREKENVKNADVAV
ncbi:MAG: DMT family transporter, partial [Chlamydiota bacterium]